MEDYKTFLDIIDSHVKHDVNYIYDCILNDKIEMFKNIIKTDPKCRKIIKRLIFFSLFEKKTESCILLLQEISNINEKFFMDNCYIQASTEFNNLEVTKYLLEKGAEPNVITTNFMCPIVNAIRHKNDEMVNLLLDYNTYVDILIFVPDDLAKYNNIELTKKVIDCMNICQLYKFNNNNPIINNYIDERKSIIWKPFGFLPNDIIKLIEEFII